MDPVVTGSLISAGSSLLGGVFGGSKGMSRKREYDSLKAQHTYKKKAAEELPASMRQGAIDGGYHPLAVLGMNPAAGGSSVSFGGSGSNGSALEAMGQGISRAAEAYMSKDERAMLKTGAALDLQNKQLSNEAQRLQNQRLAAELRLSQSGGTVSLDPASTLHSTHTGGRMPLPTSDIESAGFIASLPLQADYLLRDLAPWYLDEFKEYRDRQRRQRRSYRQVRDLIRSQHSR